MFRAFDVVELSKMERDVVMRVRQKLSKEQNGELFLDIKIVRDWNADECYSSLGIK